MIPFVVFVDDGWVRKLQERARRRAAGFHRAARRAQIGYSLGQLASMASSTSSVSCR